MNAAPILRRNHSASNGMTLVEVLVAFAVLAGVMTSVLALAGQNARFMASAEDRLAAGFLADNLMVEALATQRRIATGSTDEAIEYAGRRFEYARTVQTVNDDVLQIEFDVRREGEGQTLARVSALKQR